MKKNDQLKKRKWYAAPLVVLLAVLCIGGVELAVCAHFDPALYHSITDPVYTAVQTGVRRLRNPRRRPTSSWWTAKR